MKARFLRKGVLRIHSGLGSQLRQGIGITSLENCGETFHQTVEGLVDERRMGERGAKTKDGGMGRNNSFHFYIDRDKNGQEPAPGWLVVLFQ